MVRFAGVDVASEKHFVAMVDGSSEVLLKSKPFSEDAAGYEALFKMLGESEGLLVAMEATGHYWKNLFAALAAQGYQVALINPLRTNRFAAEDMQRTKTDAIDALGIARFAAQKKPEPTRMPDLATEELRELVRLRGRLMQDFGDRVRQLHRLVDLGFPEFTRYVMGLDTELASSILKKYPTAEAFVSLRPKALSNLKYDGLHFVGLELAQQLIEAAKTSVGRHHGYAYQVQVKYFCEDLEVLRRRIKELDRDIDSKLEEHEVGKLLTTIPGIGTNTAAHLVAALGDLARFRDERALASYIGVVPALKHSGKKTPVRAGLSHYGNADLRRALYMPTVSTIQHNPWLSAFYKRLRLRGKPAKVALIATMRKLIAAIYSVAKHRKPFVLNLVPTEAHP